MSMAVSPSWRPKGWIPMPTMATSMSSPFASARRPERKRGHFVAIVVGPERHDDDLHLHPDRQLVGVMFGETSLHLHQPFELDVAHGVRPERLGRLGDRVRRRLWNEL